MRFGYITSCAYKSRRLDRRILISVFYKYNNPMRQTVLTYPFEVNEYSNWREMMLQCVKLIGPIRNRYILYFFLLRFSTVLTIPLSSIFFVYFSTLSCYYAHGCDIVILSIGKHIWCYMSVLM